jgi:hypothetical protein
MSGDFGHKGAGNLTFREINDDCSYRNENPGEKPTH